MDIDAIASVPKSTWPTMVMMVMLLQLLLLLLLLMLKMKMLLLQLIKMLLMETKPSQSWPMLGLSETEDCLRRGESPAQLNVKLDVTLLVVCEKTIRQNDNTTIQYDNTI